MVKEQASQCKLLYVLHAAIGGCLLRLSTDVHHNAASDRIGLIVIIASVNGEIRIASLPNNGYYSPYYVKILEKETLGKRKGWS